MRRRLGGPTIRRRIITLILIPIVALVALWSFAVVSMTGDVRALIRLQSVYEYFGSPTDAAIGQIQTERRTAAEYLGSGGDAAALAGYTEQVQHTDDAVRAMRAAATDPGRQGDLTGDQRAALTAMARAADDLTALRQDVITRRVPWDQAVDRYTAIVEPGFAVESALTALQAGQLAREAQTVIELVRVREFVSREDAFEAGARAAGSFTIPQFKEFADTVEDRRIFQQTYAPALPANSRALFDAFAADPRYTALLRVEDAVLDAGPGGAGRAVQDGDWRATMDPVVIRYRELCSQAALNSAARGRAYATAELLQAALAGGAGLVAVVFSIWYSVRTGRYVNRRLLRLRASARLLATRQLPQVMQRLSAGETVDVEKAAPSLPFGADEFGDVGRALNEARRAAVEAAVEQARLRRGISGVYVNIARRSQALVHRQLKLLDAMERRATDPDALEDLFRLDHLATRMRRHAESLVILSGAAPGRMWRRPVPLVDVVGSAVGAVEEYQRVEIPPIPEIAVEGAAVADLAHMVAELVENGTALSPPHTMVTVRAGEAVHGFVLEIDDRGIGMDVDELAAANQSLAEPQEFDPTRTERLGLFVVGRLARRHGIKVTLRRSPYGGITAVVLLPREILAVRPPESPTDPSPEPPSEPSPEPPTDQLPDPLPESDGQPNLTVVQPLGRTVLPLRKRAAGEAGGLPIRARQANLAPQLRVADEPPESPPTEVSARARGDVFGAFQRGLERGRGETAPTAPEEGE